MPSQPRPRLNTIGIARLLQEQGSIETFAALGAFVLVALVSLRVSTLLVFTQYVHTNILHFGEYGLARHLDGSVYRPFAYRVLTDWLARLVLVLDLPRHRLPYLDAVVAASCPLQHAAPAATCAQVKAYVMVATLFAWGFLISTYVLAQCFVGGRLWAMAATGLAALIVNALLLEGFGQPYDFSTLFFANILFLLAARQKDVAFTALLIIACLAKESLSLFALVFAMIAWGQRPMRQVLQNLLVQSSAFICVYEGERIWFRANPGASMYHNVGAHIRYISDNTTIFSVLCGLVFTILLLYGLRKKPFVLQRSMLVLPIMLALYVVGGQPGEFRIAFDVFPIILLPIVDSWRRMIQGPT